MSEPKKILVIDDAPTILALLTNIFSKKHEVYKSNTIEGAKEILLSQSVDLVICDLNMPDGKGQDLVAFMKASVGLRDMPILILSSNDSTVVKLELLRMGVDDFVLKPFNLEELSLRVENILRRAIKI